MISFLHIDSQRDHAKSICKNKCHLKILLEPESVSAKYLQKLSQNNPFASTFLAFKIERHFG